MKRVPFSEGEFAAAFQIGIRPPPACDQRKETPRGMHNEEIAVASRWAEMEDQVAIEEAA